MIKIKLRLFRYYFKNVRAFIFNDCNQREDKFSLSYLEKIGIFPENMFKSPFSASYEMSQWSKQNKIYRC